MPPRANTADYRRITSHMLIGLTGYTGLVALACSIALQLVGLSVDINPERVNEIYVTMWCHAVPAVLFGGLWLLVRRRQYCGVGWPRAIMVAAVPLFVLSLDRLVGIAYPPSSIHDSILEPHPVRGWAHRRSVTGSGEGQIVRINRHGLRGPEIPDVKRPDEFRILFVGDSVTFGFALPWEETFVVRTGELLRRDDPQFRVTVMNAGVGGYTTWQELDYVKSEGLALQPDLVILAFCLNDMVDLLHLDDYKIVGTPIDFEFPNVQSFSGIVRAVASRAIRRRGLEVRDDLYWLDHDPFDGRDPELRQEADLFRTPPPPSVKKAWEMSLASLDDFDALCAKHDIPWVLVICPVIEQLGPDAVYDRPARPLETWAQERGVIWVDVARAFEEEMQRTGCTPLELLMDPVHPTARGSSVMASEIVLVLKSHNLVPRRRSDE